MRLAVYDALGREVAVLVDAERPAGRHITPFNADLLAPGPYLVLLASRGDVASRRITVAR